MDITRVRHARQTGRGRRVLVVAVGLACSAVLTACGLQVRTGDSSQSTAAPEQTVAVTAGSSDSSADDATVACPATDGSAPQTMTFTAAPPMCIDPSRSYVAEIVTNKGTLIVELFADRAPITVNNFVTLSRYHYYDGNSCHRIIPAYIAQCGDPTGTGSGGPGYTFEDELPAAGEYQVGAVVMANAGQDTNGSQFFVVTGPAAMRIPPDYSLFGQVTEGLDDTLRAIDAAGNPNSDGVPPLEEVTIESITITET